MLTTGLVGYLLTQTAITSIVGANGVHPLPAPVELSLYPCVTYQQASDLPEYVLAGAAGISHTRIVFDCLAVQAQGGYLIARNLALAVKKTLSGYKGTLPDGTQVFFTEIVNVTDNFDNATMLSRSSVHALIAYSD